MDVFDFVEEPQVAPSAETPFVAFADWTPQELAALRDLGDVQTFRAGTTVVASGPAGDRALYIVIEGELEVMRGGVRRAVLRTGDLFGEMSFVDGQPRSGTVRALIASKALRVRPGDVEALSGRTPRIAVKFMAEIGRALSLRLRAAWG